MDEQEASRSPDERLIAELRADLAACRAERDTWLGEHGRVSAELEACTSKYDRAMDLGRLVRERWEADCNAISARETALSGQHEALKSVAAAIVGGIDLVSESAAMGSLRALLKPAPTNHAAIPDGWQHVSSDGDSHTFRHASGVERTVTGFATWQEAARYLDGSALVPPAPAEAEPVQLGADWHFDGDVSQIAELVQHPPHESAMVERLPPDRHVERDVAALTRVAKALFVVAKSLSWGINSQPHDGYMRELAEAMEALDARKERS